MQKTMTHNANKQPITQTEHKTPNTKEYWTKLINDTLDNPDSPFSPLDNLLYGRLDKEPFDADGF